MPGTSDLVLLGTGSLARSICYSLADTKRGGRVTVLGRDAEGVHEIAIVATARARALGNSWTFDGIATDISNRSMLADRFASLRPRIILQVASLQSFWETETGTSAWARLLREGGYGVTIALQAALVDGTAIAAEEAASEALLLNACYPDAVNALLAKRNRRVLAGIGNIAILQAILADPPAGAAVRVLAHHYHLGAVSRRGPCIAPRIWIGRQELPDPLAAISDLAAIRGAEMNQVTGACTAAMLNGILSAEIFRGHLCGPLGMPGGYPVRVHKGAIELDLPPTISPEAAMAFNVDAARAEGVVVVGRHVTFTGPALSALTQVSPSLAVGFDVKDLDLVVGEFVNLREKLRCM